MRSELELQREKAWVVGELAKCPDEARYYQAYLTGYARGLDWALGVSQG
jgi:hypothetical protein